MDDSINVDVDPLAATEIDDDIRPSLLRLGKAQIDAMFARQHAGPVIDSEFLPLVEVVLTGFETTESTETVVEELGTRLSLANLLA